MYDFTFRLNLLFLNKDRKKRGIHNAQFLAVLNVVSLVGAVRALTVSLSLWLKTYYIR